MCALVSFKCNQTDHLKGGIFKQLIRDTEIKRWTGLGASVIILHYIPTTGLEYHYITPKSHAATKSRFVSRARHNTHYISEQTARTLSAVLQQPVGRHHIGREWHDRGGMWLGALSLEELAAHCAASDKGGGPGRLHKCLCLYKLRFFGVYASQLHYIASKFVRTLVENQSCNFRFRFPLDIAHIFYPKSGIISIWCLNGAFGGISSGRAALKESAIRILPSLCKPSGFSCYSQWTELWQTNFSRGFCPRIGHFSTICCWKRS